MKCKFLKTVLVSTVLVISSLANAGIISGFHQTDGGKTVDLSSLEWLTWDQTNNISRDDIENGIGNTFLADGWRYAERSEFEALFDSLWGGRAEGWQNSNQDGASWVKTNLSVGLYTNAIAFGDSADCGGSSCWAHYNVNSTQGWFHDYYGLSTGIDSINNQTYSYSSTSSASLSNTSALVRSTTVPEPSTLAIFALGIIGLASRRFKK